jgi:hypothetical protein
VEARHRIGAGEKEAEEAISGELSQSNFLIST